MKYLIIVVALIFVGCEGGSPEQARRNVVKDFPNAEIYRIPGQKYNFIVVDSLNGLMIVECLNFSNDEVSEIMVLPKIVRLNQ